jgi:hypothetical protein
MRKDQSELTFPRRMLCWDKSEVEARVCIVLGIFPDRKKYPVITDNDSFNHAKELESAEVTMQEIADKFGIPIDQLKIKK